MPKKLMLIQEREGAWVDGESIFCVVARHPRILNLNRVKEKVELPRMLVEFRDDGSVYFTCAGGAGVQIGNVDSDGRVCFGKNPPPQDPWEAWEFFWNSRFTHDLVWTSREVSMKHTKIAFHDSYRCTKIACKMHGLVENCPKTHQCTEGNCVCDRPTCRCPKTPAKHDHGRLEDHHRGGQLVFGGARRFAFDARCECCLGECPHVSKVECVCPPPGCACLKGVCACHTNTEACDPEDDDEWGARVCGCGLVDAWRKTVVAQKLGDWDGSVPASAQKIPAEAVGVEFPDFRPFDVDGKPCPGYQEPPESLPDYRYRVGDAVRVLAPLGPQPGWWLTGRTYLLNGRDCKVTSLRGGKFYRLTSEGGKKGTVREDCLERVDEGFAFQVDQKVALVPGQLHGFPETAEGRALTIIFRGVNADRTRYYEVGEAREGWDLQPGDYVQERHLRAATPDDPVGLVDPDALFKFKDGDFVKLTPLAGKMHWIGLVAQVSQRRKRGAREYFVKGGNWAGEGFWVSEQGLEKSGGPVSKSFLQKGFAVGSIVRLRELTPRPVGWTRTLETQLMLKAQFPIRWVAAGFPTRAYDVLIGRVHEAWLETVSGQGNPDEHEETVTVRDCGVGECLTCPGIVTRNPNYRGPRPVVQIATAEEVQLHA